MAYPQFFQFEADFVASLRCIPMQVRYNLDTCGIKLKLSHWHQFSQQERQQLAQMSCSIPAEIQAYREYLAQLIWAYTQTPAAELPVAADPDWLNSAEIPEVVQLQAEKFNIQLTTAQWAALTPMQRFALIKLSRPSHENKNFFSALQEFQLV